MLLLLLLLVKRSFEHELCNLKTVMRFPVLLHPPFRCLLVSRGSGRHGRGATVSVSIVPLRCTSTTHCSALSANEVLWGGYCGSVGSTWQRCGRRCVRQGWACICCWRGGRVRYDGHGEELGERNGDSDLSIPSPRICVNVTVLTVRTVLSVKGSRSPFTVRVLYFVPCLTPSTSTRDLLGIC